MVAVAQWEETGTDPASYNLQETEMLPTINPSETFKDNLQMLPSIDGVQRIELADQNATVVGTIENAPGQQGSLAVYQYLKQAYGVVSAEAAEHGLLIFGEHSADARARPGAHPNIDRLLAIAAGGSELSVEIIPATA